jgi:hypothetical protein
VSSGWPEAFPPGGGSVDPRVPACSRRHSGGAITTANTGDLVARPRYPPRLHHPSNEPSTVPHERISGQRVKRTACDGRADFIPPLRTPPANGTTPDCSHGWRQAISWPGKRLIDEYDGVVRSVAASCRLQTADVHEVVQSTWKRLLQSAHDPRHRGDVGGTARRHRIAGVVAAPVRRRTPMS